MSTQAARHSNGGMAAGAGAPGGVTARQAGRVAVIALTLAALAMSGMDMGGVAGAVRAVISTLAFVTVTGFAVLDGSGALPSSLTSRPYVWALTVPLSIGINVITGTALAAFGPGISSPWQWGVTAVVVGLAESAHVIRRRLS